MSRRNRRYIPTSPSQPNESVSPYYMSRKTIESTRELPIQSDPDSIMNLQLFAETPQPQSLQVNPNLLRELLETEYTFKKDLEILTYILVNKPVKISNSTWPSTQKSIYIPSEQNDAIENLINQLALVSIKLSENSEAFIKNLIGSNKISKGYTEFTTYLKKMNKPSLIKVLEKTYEYIKKYLEHGVVFLLLKQNIGDSNLITLFNSQRSFLTRMNIPINEKEFMNKFIQPSLRITRVGIDIVGKFVKSLPGIGSEHSTEESNRALAIRNEIDLLCQTFQSRFASLTDFVNECTRLKSSKSSECSNAINAIFSS